MLRLILGVFLGLVVGLLVILAIEGTGHTMFPPDASVNLTDPSEMGRVMEHVSREAKVMILLAWSLGVLSAVSTANLVAGRRALAGRITAVLLLTFAIWTMIVTHYPLWLSAGSVIGALAGMALADKAFGKPRLSPPR